VNHLNRTCLCLSIVWIAIFASPSSALAIPALPSSFYGTVKLNNANVPDGTVVQVFNGDQLIALGYTQTYQGDSVYALDVPGDDTDTVVIDGGREGDTLTFKVGGIFANETGAWHGATNVRLNLSVSSASKPMVPQETPTPVPTQTAIFVIPTASETPTTLDVIQPASKTLTPTEMVSPTAIISSQPAKRSDIPVSTPEMPTNSLTDTSSKATDNPRDIGLFIAIIIIAIVIGSACVFWITRGNNHA
jgi:hypothetical protein